MLLTVQQPVDNFLVFIVDCAKLVVVQYQFI